ncbi:hypothetical protein Tco_0925094 [Tanacetum coccineum]|uniref:Uncharacterized protein n=1 Tax=Tanacetum coccineum TaxID=301880 RepID=A0ABQ5D748_9ASTR
MDGVMHDTNKDDSINGKECDFETWNHGWRLMCSNKTKKLIGSRIHTMDLMKKKEIIDFFTELDQTYVDENFQINNQEGHADLFAELDHVAHLVVVEVVVEREEHATDETRVKGLDGRDESDAGHVSIRRPKIGKE